MYIIYKCVHILCNSSQSHFLDFALPQISQELRGKVLLMEANREELSLQAWLGMVVEMGTPQW